MPIARQYKDNDLAVNLKETSKNPIVEYRLDYTSPHPSNNTSHKPYSPIPVDQVLDGRTVHTIHSLVSFSFYRLSCVWRFVSSLNVCRINLGQQQAARIRCTNCFDGAFHDVVEYTQLVWRHNLHTPNLRRRVHYRNECIRHLFFWLCIPSCEVYFCRS